MKRTLLLTLLFSFAAIAADPAVLNTEQDARYRNLAQDLRCLVCQNQNIADSNAPLAADLRDQVKMQILAGRSDAEIKQYMTDRYGDFVLYKPPFKLTTIVLWAGPAALVLLGLGIALLRARRSRQIAAPAKPDSAQLKKLLDEKS